MPPPQNWNPQVFPQLLCQQLKPYQLNPLPGITYHNMPGQQAIAVDMNPGYEVNPYDNMNGQHQMGDQYNNNGDQPPGQPYYVPDVNQYNNYQPVYIHDDNATYGK